jgi:hypothetical protein
MICLDDLYQVAEDLRKRGVAAEYESLYSSHGWLEGLDVGDDFFPVWELGLAENLEALERADFAAIKKRRTPGWSMVPPRSLGSTGEKPS